MKLRKGQWILLLLLVLCLGLLIWALWENTALEVNEHPVFSPKLPAAFEGFRIAQISDYHNCKEIDPIPLLTQAAPDIIVITGDLIDSRRTDVTVSLEFVREAVKIAPCYYVSGNHEARTDAYEELRAGLLEAGVTILDNEIDTLTRDGQRIHLLGLTDIGMQDALLKNVPAQEGFYTIALSHRPELFSAYASMGYDLVFCGHAHGGQFRLPLLGGLYAPGQGLFPAYSSGIYTLEGTQMLVSRGIGNSIIPLRFNNPPEILLAILHTEKR